MADELSLVDDLASVLAHMVVGWEDRLGVDLAEHPEVVRVLARYRERRPEMWVALNYVLGAKYPTGIFGPFPSREAAREAIRSTWIHPVFVWQVRPVQALSEYRP